jgi:hypothetical protein
MVLSGYFEPEVAAPGYPKLAVAAVGVGVAALVIDATGALDFKGDSGAFSAARALSGSSCSGKNGTSSVWILRTFLARSMHLGNADIHQMSL